MENINIDEIARIAQLILKQQDGELTPHEELDLNEWIGSNQEHINLYKKLSNNNRLAHDLLEMEEVNVEQHVKNIMARLQRPRVRAVRIYRVAAAACIAGLIALGSYILYNNTSSKDQLIRQKNIQAPLNNNAALLTLSDGRQIALDSVKEDGIIAVQGNVQIIKQNGHILYVDKNTAQPAIVYNTISTPKGADFALTLHDGTKLWLNAGSSISFPTVFSATERKVKLVGEAYFEVAPLHQQMSSKKQTRKIPFTIEDMNDKWQVQVLGTHFNIYAYPEADKMKTTLLEGSVKVVSKHPSQLNSIVLTPGQQAAINNSGSIAVANGVDIEEVMAWRNDKFNFQDADLNTILTNIARWYNADVVYQQPVNEKYTINISRRTPLKELLNYIEKSGGVHFELTNKKIIVNQ